MKWDNAKEKAWDLFFDADAAYQMNRWHLLSNNYDSIGVACNCDTALSEICIIELGWEIKPLVPVEFNHFVEGKWVNPEYYLNKSWVRNWDYWDKDECKHEMPDFFFCISEQKWASAFRRLDTWSLPEFKLPNDPTCWNDWRDGYCSEVTTEVIYDDWEILYSMFTEVFYES